MKHVVLTLCLFLSLTSSALAQQTTQTQFKWTFAGPPGSQDRILALLSDPRDERVTYAATPGGGVWKTLDGGTTWAPIFDSQPSLQVCSLAIDPVSPDVIYAGTGDTQTPGPAEGVSRSADAGRTWTTLPRITNRPLCALGVDPWNTSRVFAGSEEGLFVSSDSGASWTKTLSAPVTSIAFDGRGVVFVGLLGDETAGARTRILTRSVDSGATWTDLPLQRNPFTLDALTTWVTIRTNGNNVYAAVAFQSTPQSQVDFYASNDGGNHWSPTYGIGQARPPMDLINSPDGGLYLTGVNLLASGINGSGWTVIPTATADFHSAVISLDGLILAGEKGLESITSTGGPRGIAPLPVAQILGVNIDPAAHVWAGGPSGLFELLPTLESRKANVGAAGKVGLADAASGTTTIISAGTTRVYTSTDSGGHFSINTVIADDELRAPYPPVVVDPVIPSTAFVAGRRVYRTTNGGGSWTALRIVDADPTRVVIALAMSTSFRSLLYAATACLPEVTLTTCPAISVIWRSTNSGQTWTQVSVVNGFVNQFAVDPRQTNRIYAAIGAFPGGPTTAAGSVPGDLLLSTTAGAVWSSVLGNLPRTTINTVLIDPESLPLLFTQPALIVYVGTASGVFVNFDASSNSPRWVDISPGLPPSPITDLALLQPDGVLVAGTFGRGAYRTSVVGLAADLIVRPLSQDLTLMRGTTLTAGLGLDNPSNRTTIDWQLTTSEAWLGLPQASGRLRPLTSAQVPISISAVDLQTGVYMGRLQAASPFGIQNVSVHVHVTPAAFQMTIAAGDGAVGLASSSLPPMQVLVLDENRAPLPGAPVTFTITSGSGTLSARTAITNDAGTAGVVLKLPKEAGTVQVVAAIGKLSVMFTATVIAPPTLLTDSVFDAVTFNANTSFGPGSILLILGQNLSASEAAASGPLPSSLAATSVLLTTQDGDVPLPLFAVSGSQVTALVPFDMTPGTYLLHLEVGSVRSNTVEISVAAFSPGIFAVNGGGRGAGVFVKSDGTIVTTSNPADRGAIVTFYSAGLGPVSPPIESGQPGASAEPLNRTTQLPRVFFDRYAANVTYSGLTPGIAGRYQVAVQVPALVAPATNVSVSLTIGGFTSNRVTIPVR